MSSLNDCMDELLTRISQGRELGPTSVEPIYYLVFGPDKILEAKRALPAWLARLRNAGWVVHQLSVADEVADILQNTPLRKIWLRADRQDPLNWERTNQALSQALTNGSLLRRFEQKLESFKGQPNALLLVTDLEALHPYLRIGSIEGQLYGKFHVPTVFLYPGTRSGKSSLKFLGFYSDDGNYRSNHIGC